MCATLMQPLLFKTQYFPLSDLHSRIEILNVRYAIRKGNAGKLLLKVSNAFV